MITDWSYKDRILQSEINRLRTLIERLEEKFDMSIFNCNLKPTCEINSLDMGDNIVCISSCRHCLTVGKTYKVLSEDMFILCDDNTMFELESADFKMFRRLIE